VAKPIVDGLESDLKGHASVLRLNILDSVGMNAARRFGVRAVPAFFVVNGQGHVVDAQMGIPNRDKLGAQVEALLAK
jgi:thioredoxin-like negative regulator of GroEL